MMKKKRILITGGSTWVAVDAVRVLTSRFTGATAVMLARYFLSKGWQVTLLINPCRIRVNPRAGLEVIEFTYFDELKDILTRRLKRTSYDMIVHTAAVSDYRVRSSKRTKIPSKGRRTLKLAALPKLTAVIKRYAKKAVLVQFKLESTGRTLIDKAHKSLLKNGFDFVIANSIADVRAGRACLVSSERKVINLLNRKQIGKHLAAVFQGSRR